MPALADLERLLERLFERTTARVFRVNLRPVQVERRVERAMERARMQQGGRTLVPGRYRVRLHPLDLPEVAGPGGPEALAGRLAEACVSFARSHGYHLVGRPVVALVADAGVERGGVEVEALPASGPGRAIAESGAVVEGDPAEGAVTGAAAEGAAPEGANTGAQGGAAVDHGGSAGGGGPVPDIPRPDPLVPVAESGGIRGDGTRTLVFRRPVPAPARAVLRVIARDGTEETVEVDGSPLTVGRAQDNRLVLADPRVSRHHGRLQARRGTLVYRDLGSTNGTRVNGVRVDEVVLGAGDRLLLGDTVLVVEQLPD